MRRDGFTNDLKKRMLLSEPTLNGLWMTGKIYTYVVMYLWHLYAWFFHQVLHRIGEICVHSTWS